MKLLALLVLLGVGCEHDPRYEHHDDKRPAPADTAPKPEPEQPLVERTIERSPSPKIVPLKKRIRHHKP